LDRGPQSISWPQQRLDGAAFVHRAVASGHLIEGQGQVEDLARVNLPVSVQVDQFRQEAAHRTGTAVQVDVREEELLPRIATSWSTPTNPT
jgi:hypothetical protein